MMEDLGSPVMSPSYLLDTKQPLEIKINIYYCFKSMCTNVCLHKTVSAHGG